MENMPAKSLSSAYSLCLVHKMYIKPANCNLYTFALQFFAFLGTSTN